jgi:UPF0716 protein FxsA
MSQPVRLAVILALVAFPLLEIGLLIRAGQEIGFWRLALIVVSTAVLGTVIIRRVGFSVFARIWAHVEAGRGGLEPVLDGFLLFVAGMLLIFPGLISDGLGLILLIPQVRQLVVHSGLPKLFGIRTYDRPRARARPQPSPRPSGFEPGFEPGADPGADREPPGTVTIEGEYERLSEKTVKPEGAVRPRRASN